MFVKGYDIFQALVLKNYVEDPTMGEIIEDMSLGSASRCDYLSNNWIYEYIIDMDIQGYTNISHLGRRFFDTSFIGKSSEQE